ncbi:hypothetical protein ACHWQZ_G017527 [Mnemiopsis leidyi]
MAKFLHSYTLHVLQIIYYIFVILFGTLGNAFVVYASYFYRNFQMGRTTVTLIRHVSLCDLCFIIIPVLTSLITHFKQEYVFGASFCVAEILIQSTIALAHITFVCLLAVHRLVRCVRPRRRGSDFPETGNCADSNMRNSSSHVAMGMENVSEMYEMRDQHKGMSRMDSSEGNSGDNKQNFKLGHSGQAIADALHSDVPAESIQLLLAILVPFIGTICANTAIWIFTCSRSQKYNYRPIITVTVISVQVILSWVPMMVILIFKNFVGSQIEQSHLDHISLNLHLLGIITNPIVYTIFSQGFKNFLKQKVYDIVTCYVCHPSTEECVAPGAAVVKRRQSCVYPSGMKSVSPSVKVDSTMSLRSTTLTTMEAGPSQPYRQNFLGPGGRVGGSARRNSVS